MSIMKENKISNHFKKSSQKVLREFGNKVYDHLKNKVVESNYIDYYFYKRSLKNLEIRKNEENGLKDILNTTGYTLVDFDAVNLDELKEGDSPYSGFGQFPGKYSGYGIYTNMKMQQERSSIKALAETVAKENPTTVLEIGSAQGGSFYLWSRYLNSAKVLVSLDIRLPGRRSEFFRQFSPRKEISTIEGDSREKQTYKLTKNKIGDQNIDFLYIDGSHKYNHVKQDFDTYSNLVGENGIIGLHDISHPGTGVPQLWEELEKNYCTEEFGNTPVKNGLVWV